MIKRLPEPYQARPACMEDLPSAVRLFNTCGQQLVGVEDKFTVERTGNEWREPGFNLETDTRVVTDGDGEIAGYYEVWDADDPHVKVFGWGRVHPAHTGHGIGTYLIHWAEERSRRAVEKAPAGARVAMELFALSSNRQAQELFINSGFSLIRHSLRMVIDLNGSIPEPGWPEGIIVRSMNAGKEGRAVLHAVREAFQDHWGYVEHPFEEEYERWQHHYLNSKDFDPALWFLAMDGDEIAGVSLCRLETDDDKEMGWVGKLGVRRPWRRKGIGLALLHHTFREFARRGKRRVGLGVDAQSLTGATRLYERAGMRPDPSWQFSEYEKELRPGRDLRTQSLEA